MADQSGACFWKSGNSAEFYTASVTRRAKRASSVHLHFPAPTNLCAQYLNKYPQWVSAKVGVRKPQLVLVRSQTGCCPDLCAAGQLRLHA